MADIITDEDLNLQEWLSERQIDAEIDEKMTASWPPWPLSGQFPRYNGGTIARIYIPEARDQVSVDITNKTYPIREELKAAGFHYIGNGVWRREEKARQITDKEITRITKELANAARGFAKRVLIDAPQITFDGAVRIIARIACQAAALNPEDPVEAEMISELKEQADRLEEGHGLGIVTGFYDTTLERARELYRHFPPEKFKIDVDHGLQFVIRTKQRLPRDIWENYKAEAEKLGFRYWPETGWVKRISDYNNEEER